MEEYHKWFKGINWNSNGIYNNIPRQDLFGSNDEFVSFLQEVKADETMKSATSVLPEIYERFAQNKFKPVRVPTKCSNRNVGQSDFGKYNLIFEGER